jgi:hypothetical protein
VFALRESRRLTRISPASKSIGPGEAERFADTQADVDEELEQRPARPGVGEEAGELLAFEDRDLLRRPVGLLARFEIADGVLGEPAATDGEAADPVERDQDDTRRGRRERALRDGWRRAVSWPAVRTPRAARCEPRIRYTL